MQSLTENIINTVPKTVSDDQLIERLRGFLETADLSNTTNSIVRRKLEQDFGIDLSDKKVFIREQVAVFLQNQYEEDDEYRDNDEEYEEVNDGICEVDKEICDWDARVDQSGGRSQRLNNEGKKRGYDENNACSLSAQLQELVGVPELNNEGKKRGHDANTVCSLSPQLQELVGVPELTRTEVVKRVWAYTRKKNLQDPKDRRTIKCDALLRSLFGVDSINVFLMNKAISKHITTLDSDDGDVVKETPKKKKKKRDSEEDTGEPKQKAKVQKGSVKSGFIAPYPISDALKNFTGESHLSRADAVKRIWDYIKKHNLQDPSDKRMVISDEKLKELFGVETFQGFTVSKLLASHFLKLEQ